MGPPTGRGTLLLCLAVLAAFAGLFAPPSAAREAETRTERAEAIAEEARQFWDLKAYPQAIAKYRESLALDPKGETYRELGDLYSERDMHADAVAAFRAAIAADPSLEPELRLSLAQQLIWSDRSREAVPLLESVVENRPHDVEAQRYLALAYRWSDRLKESEAAYRKVLSGNPADVDARKGLAESLLWQGRFRAATAEFRRALAASSEDPEALVGLSRARLFLDMPEEAQRHVARAAVGAPADPEVRGQIDRVRERLSRFAALEVRGSRDSDDLSLFETTLSVHQRPAAGLDVDGSVRQLFFRQGSPGKQENIGDEDSVDGTGGSLSAAWRWSPAIEWRAGAGYTRYDVGDFDPWSGNVGATVTPADTVRIDADWERTHWDSILSFQDRVTIDTAGLSVSKHFRWKTEVSASAALVYHHNENVSGQDRENRGQRFGLDVTRRLYLRGDVVHVTGILRFGWLGFSEDLDVGVYDPERYTTQEAGVDWRWRFRPHWEVYGTVTGGAQQEKGAESGPTYSAEVGLDRRIGLGLVSAGGFASDSNARGQGEGFRRYGGLLRFRVPF
ncbi:MAG TPA: tetratricopeptide repeat protein [Candidatus Aquicultoraceae bacterium]|nr:tetratricopeptide repeat protein [Candidatus Aquicultoraceae bacterium]